MWSQKASKNQGNMVVTVPHCHQPEYHRQVNSWEYICTQSNSIHHHTIKLIAIEIRLLRQVWIKYTSKGMCKTV